MAASFSVKHEPSPFSPTADSPFRSDKTSPKRPYISEAMRQQVEKEANYRCGYCLTAQQFTAKRLHVEHIISLFAGGGSDIQNLWLACDLCNSYKGPRTHALDPLTDQTVSLFNPRKQTWSDHFTWSEDGLYILGQTPTGRATIIALRLNNSFLVEARGWWTQAGWHPPLD